MKILWFVLGAFAISGCSTMLTPVRSTPGESYASLTLVTLQPPAEPKWPYGLIAIDSHRLDPDQKLQAYVAQGRRTVSYACPDVITMDGPARLTYEFVAGATYELVCGKNGAAQIRISSRAGG